MGRKRSFILRRKADALADGSRAEHRKVSEGWLRTLDESDVSGTLFARAIHRSLLA